MFALLFYGFIIASGIALVILVLAVLFHDHTKDEKGKDIKDKIDDYLLR